MKDEHPYSLTHMWTGGFHESVWICCRSTVSANVSDMGRQQVIDEDDVVLWHNRFPLCPGWGWGLLFAPPVIAWRIDSEQCAISRTVIKPHYSFFTTPIWVLETQWATLKRHRCLVTVRPLPVLLSPLYFAAPASPSPFLSFESSAVCPFAQSSLLFSVLFLSKFSFTLLHQTQISCIRTLLRHFSDVEITVPISLSLILPQICHFFTHFRSLSSLLLKSQSSDWVTTFILHNPSSLKSRGGDKELISAIITIQTLCR